MQKLGRFIFMLFAVLTATLLLYAGALVYFQGNYAPYLNKVMTVPFLESSPKSTIRGMQRAMTETDTLHSDLEFKFIKNSEKKPYAIRTKADFDGGLANKLLGQLKVENELEIQNLTYLFNFESRSSDKYNFLRVTEVPAIPYLDLTAIKNKWYEYSQIKKFSEYNDMMLSAKSLISVTSFFNRLNRLPDEYINGSMVYHYETTIDVEGLNGAYAYLKSKYQLKQNINFDKLADFKFELWIGKSNKRLYQMKAEYEKDSSLIYFLMQNSDFNSKVTIEEPTLAYGSHDFSVDLFGKTNFLDLPLFGYLINLDMTKFLADLDQDGLYSGWEKIFGTDPLKADTDGDDFIDGPEIMNGYNPTGKGKLFVIE
ncbi:MAG: hypothetical protein WCV50_00795 [Patescibacteria group bacterium]|jgi:hypothetical protein